MASSTPEVSPSPALRVLLVISAEPTDTMRAEIHAGRQPRRDYDMLRDALAADMLTPDIARRSRLGRLLSRRAGRSIALAVEAFRRRRRYDAIYTDGENVGLPLALLLALARVRRGCPRHIMLSHYLSPAKKRLLFRLGVARRIDTLITHSAAQRELALRALRMPESRVLRLPYFADERFWRPDVRPMSREAAPPRPDSVTPPMICAVGLEFRDYTTLVAAVTGLDVELRIAAASAWSHHAAFGGSPTLPSNVAVDSYTYLPLRDLYAAARFVVVPLRDVDNQAGVTVILEAMAMGKAVIVTATRGQTDIVRDRRNGGRGRVERAWWPGFVDDPEVADQIARLSTGLYVAPSNPAELRRAIQYLLAQPDYADDMGRNGRLVVETCFTLDAFTARFAAAIRGTPVSSPTRPPLAAGNTTTHTL